MIISDSIISYRNQAQRKEGSPLESTKEDMELSLVKVCHFICKEVIYNFHLSP